MFENSVNFAKCKSSKVCEFCKLCKFSKSSDKWI